MWPGAEPASPDAQAAVRRRKPEPAGAHPPAPPAGLAPSRGHLGARAGLKEKQGPLVLVLGPLSSLSLHQPPPPHFIRTAKAAQPLLSMFARLRGGLTRGLKAEPSIPAPRPCRPPSCALGARGRRRSAPRPPGCWSPSEAAQAGGGGGGCGGGAGSCRHEPFFLRGFSHFAAVTATRRPSSAVLSRFHLRPPGETRGGGHGHPLVPGRRERGKVTLNY